MSLPGQFDCGCFELCFQFLILNELGLLLLQLSDELILIVSADDKLPTHICYYDSTAIVSHYYNLATLLTCSTYCH